MGPESEEPEGSAPEAPEGLPTEVPEAPEGETQDEPAVGVLEGPLETVSVVPEPTRK